MTEEQPKEKKQEPQQISVKHHVQDLVTALKKAGNIDRYEVFERTYPPTTKLFFNNGADITTNPTLMGYIARAEKKLVENNVNHVIEIAANLIENDLDEIREVLG